MYFLTIFLPSISFLVRGKIISFILSLIIQIIAIITFLFFGIGAIIWLFLSVWATISYNNGKHEKRNKKLVNAINASNPNFVEPSKTIFDINAFFTKNKKILTPIIASFSILLLVYVGYCYFTSSNFENNKSLFYEDELVNTTSTNDIAKVDNEVNKVSNKQIQKVDEVGTSNKPINSIEIISDKTYIYSEPSEENITKSYLIKGDIAEPKGSNTYEFLPIIYKTSKGKIINGYIKLESIRYLNIDKNGNKTYLDQ